MKQNMRIDEILVPSAMLMSNPSKDKVTEVTIYMVSHREFDKPIKVNKNGILVDGFIRHLVYISLKKEGLADGIIPWVEIVKGNPDSYKYKETKYVFGHHDNCDKEYVWRMPDKFKDTEIKVGQRVTVSTSHGKLPITVSRVEVLDEPPRAERIKKVVGVLVEKKLGE